jgi:trehalose 6-phosphate phosphatase
MATAERVRSVSRRGTRRFPPTLARNCALFLDIDGTLVEDAAKPDNVRIDEDLAKALPGVAARLGNALALVTSRSIRGVDHLFPQLRLPMAGRHGSERHDAEGTIHVNAPDPSTFTQIRQILEVLSDRYPGLLLEDKGNTLALHYRDVPHLAAHVHRVLRTTVKSAGGSLDLQPGKRMLEVRPGSRNKGTAITEFMREAPFAGRRPVFAGDDRADEFGFAVVDSMGGWSIKVGKGPTHARYRPQDIAAVRRWLLAPVAADSAGRDQDELPCAASTSR